MSRGSEGAAVSRAGASWVTAVVVAFCAVLLLKWLAVVAFVAVGLFAFLCWARGDWDGARTPRGQGGRPARSTRLPYTIDDVEVPSPRTSAHDDCTWCGLRGGHRDGEGRRVRPRHAHAV